MKDKLLLKFYSAIKYSLEWKNKLVQSFRINLTRTS